MCASVKYHCTVVIQSSGGLSKEQIEQMVNEAEQFAESDKKKKVLIQTSSKSMMGLCNPSAWRLSTGVFDQ